MSSHPKASAARRRAVCLALPFALCVAERVLAQTTIAHAKGSTTVPSSPRRVLVYDLASLDSLQALGVTVLGVPSTRFPAYLSAYGGRAYAKIGSVFEPDLEAVNAARPDLIIVGGRSSAKYAELARMAPTIDLTVDLRDFLGSIYRNTQVLSRVFGRQELAQALVSKLQASIASLQQRGAQAGRGLVILTTGGRMSAYGPGSRFGVMHDGFGITPAVRGVQTATHGQAISFEFILQTDPDWLFVVDRDAAIGREGAAAERLLDNELVRQTTAWRKRQVVYLDAASWYTVGAAGLIALQANVDQLSAVIGRR